MISRQGETPLEKTIYVLKNMNLFDMSPFKEKEAYFRRLLDVANVNALSPKERATYDENLKIYRDWRATMEYAVEEAETKGKAEGERLATLRNARNMKKAGVDLSLIAECTGLSLEIIQSLWSDKPVADWNYSGWHGSWGEVSFLIRAIRIWSDLRLMRLTPH